MNTSAPVMDSSIPADAAESDSAPSEVEVRRRGAVTGAVGVAGAVVALAWFVRASASGSVLDWTVCVALGAVSVLHLFALVDARTPLLVADEQGLRVRRGRSWHGLPWREVASVEYQPRRGLLHDGSLCLVPAPQTEAVAGEDREPAAGTPVCLALSVTTTVVGTEDLTAGLRELAGAAVDINVEAHRKQPNEPEPEAECAEPQPAASPATTEPAEPEPSQTAGPEAGERTILTAPAARRELHGAIRAEVVLGSAALRLDRDERADVSAARLPEEPQLRRDNDVDLVEDTVLWGDRVSEVLRSARSVEPLVVEDHAALPVSDPVIGPELSGARSRLGLTVDQLAERTRIRPHVIESIEVDDFAPCGGDFYARGHLRTLARVVGIDAAPLLRNYDAHYADAPIDARRVFEAELATGVGGAIHGTRSGPNWSLLVAAVMTVVLVWSVVQLLTAGPDDVTSDVPQLNSSGGVDNARPDARGAAVPVVLTAAGGGAQVIVRSGSQVVFDDQLAFMQTVQLDVAPPVRISSTDGGLQVSIDGVDEGALGKTGHEAQDVFVP